MSRRTPNRRREAEADEERPRRGRQQAPSMGPMIALFVLLVAALGVAGWAFKSQKQAEQPGTTPANGGGSDPFAGMRDDVQTPTPRPRSGSGGSDMEIPDGKHLVSRSPDDLLDAPQWVQGRDLAQQASVLAEEAEAASKAGNQSLFLEKAVAARETYREATAAVADWELEIQDLYSENDRQVRAVKREITAWYKKIQKYHGVRLKEGE